jgi:hypothetical protein
MKLTVKINEPQKEVPEVLVNGKPAKRLYLASEHQGERLIYRRGSVIVKVEPPMPAFDQSARELYLWNQLIEEEDKWCFGPILAGEKARRGHRGWIAQPFYRFRRGRRPTSAWELVRYLGEKYNIQDFINWSDEPADYPIMNWGMIRKRKKIQPIIFDYGW